MSSTTTPLPGDLKPWKARNVTTFAIEPDGSGSRVTWSLTGQKTLMTKLMGLVKSMDKLIGPDFEKGLAQLKATTEKPTGRLAPAW